MFRRILVTVLLAVLCVGFNGCKKEEPAPSPSDTMQEMQDQAEEQIDEENMEEELDNLEEEINTDMAEE